jgi:23S rRNA pseudouridine1911/1915/1917 synthase
MSSHQEEICVSAASGGTRLDRWLTEELQELEYEVSRSQVQEWIRDGYVANAKGKVKASDLIEPGACFVVQIPKAEPIFIEGDNIPLEIVFEDDDVVVVNKPRGLVVHPAAGHTSGTVVNGLVGKGIKLSELGGAHRPGVVHRIDKDTSGLLMFAKTDVAYRGLAEQLKAHSVERVYQAVAHGVMTHNVGMIDAPIGRDPHNRQRMAIVDRGKHAVTHFSVQHRFNQYSWLELQLETGRTHQIRVHMAYIEHPLAGDKTYGPKRTLPIDGQALHAMTLGFSHPRSGERMTFKAELPADMARLLEGLRSGQLG